MNELALIGKKKTLSIFASILLITLINIFITQTYTEVVDQNKLTTQIIRFLLTAGLLYAVYIGKNWARITSIVLFSFAIISALILFFTLNVNFMAKVPILVMIYIYSKSIYHFTKDISFKEFMKFQKTNPTKLNL